MGKKKAPPPPDYVALAKQQGELNKETAKDVTQSNRPNQYNPYGSSVWAQDPTTQQWTNKQEFSPEMAQLMAQIMALKQGAGTKAMEAANTPLDLGGLPPMPGPGAYRQAQMPQQPQMAPPPGGGKHMRNGMPPPGGGKHMRGGMPPPGAGGGKNIPGGMPPPPGAPAPGMNIQGGGMGPQQMAAMQQAMGQLRRPPAPPTAYM